MFTSDGGGLPGLPVGGLCDCFAVFAAELAELRHAWLTSPATLHLPADRIVGQGRLICFNYHN